MDASRNLRVDRPADAETVAKSSVPSSPGRCLLGGDKLNRCVLDILPRPQRHRRKLPRRSVTVDECDIRNEEHLLLSLHEGQYDHSVAPESSPALIVVADLDDTVGFAAFPVTASRHHRALGADGTWILCRNWRTDDGRWNWLALCRASGSRDEGDWKSDRSRNGREHTTRSLFHVSGSSFARSGTSRTSPPTCARKGAREGSWNAPRHHRLSDLGLGALPSRRQTSATKPSAVLPCGASASLAPLVPPQQRFASGSPR